jgi:hypothetical protein
MRLAMAAGRTALYFACCEAVGFGSMCSWCAGPCTERSVSVDPVIHLRHVVMLLLPLCLCLQGSLPLQSQFPLVLLLVRFQQTNHLQLPHKRPGGGTGVPRGRGTAVTDTGQLTE